MRAARRLSTRPRRSATIASTARDSGAIRWALNAAALGNIRNNIGRNDTETAIQVTFTFSDRTSYLHTIPFPVNNVVFIDKGLPSGGTAGQFLAKASAVDYRAQWVNAPSGGTPDLRGSFHCYVSYSGSPGSVFFFTDENQSGDPVRYVTFNNLQTALGGLNQAAVDARVRAVAPTVPSAVIIIANIASFDATQDRFEDSSGNAVTVPNGSIVTLTQAVYDAAVADTQFTPNAQAVFLTR